MVDKEEKTHFGYETVNTDEKVGKVAGVFHSVANKYDIMNDLMSGGAQRIWKRFTIEASCARKGQKILDVAGGTADLAMRFSKIVGAEGLVVLSDINSSMLGVGRDRMINQGLTENVEYVQADAESLPFPDDYFDCITIAFGLRNVTDKAVALSSMLRILKPGGKLLVLEFSKPTNALLEKVYDAYSFNVLPKLGEWVANDGDSYRYLVESIRMHPDQESLKQMMIDSGFDRVDYHNMTGGIVALHKGFKA